MTLIGPLFWYELWRLPRRGVLHRWRVLYVGALLLGLVVVYLRSFRDATPLEALANPGALDSAGNAAFAETFLMAFLAVQQLAVIVLTPLYAAGSIADEKERGTLDFLLSSPLPHYQILLGKLLARLAFVGSILAVGWPVLMLTFLFGGVDFEHLLGGFAISAVTAIFLANWGIMLACMKKNFRETLPGIAAVLLLPAIIGMFGCCLTEIAAASPVTILGFIFRSWLIGDPAKDSTWPMVAIFSALYLLPTILLFATAHKAFGEQSPSEIEPDPTTADVPVVLGYLPPAYRTYDVRPLRFDEDPFVWKQANFHLPWFSPERGCFVMGLLSVAAGLIFIALFALFAILANNLAKGDSIRGTTNALALLVFVPLAALAPALLGARAAASLGRERSGQTLLTLLTLPAERIEILLAIAKAILYRDRRVIGFLAAVWVFVAFAGSITAGAAIAVFVSTVGTAAWSLAFGIWLSVRVETPTRASLIFLSIWGGILLLPWFAAPFFPTGDRAIIELACPPYGMVEVISSAERKKAFDWLPVRVTLATGFGMMAAAAAFAWHAARSFEREGR